MMNASNLDCRDAGSMGRVRRTALPLWVPLGGGAAILASLALGTVSVAAPQDENPQVTQTRDTLEKWVETRRILSKERKDWALGKEMLTDRIALVKREIESLQAKIADAEKNITKADEQKVGLVDENERLRGAAASLTASVAPLEQKLRRLLPRLPQPVFDHVQRLSQRLPEDPEKTELSLSERYQNVVGILNEVDKYHRQITVQPDVRKLPDGSTAQVTTVYLGISAGYYVSNNGQAAGVGRVTDTGWEWTPASDHAEAIARAIAIYKNEQPATFVPLPVNIR